MTSTGHAQFVELKDGSWWAVFLATRPYRGNQYNLGRETFLLPVAWRDGWPVILPRGERVPLVEKRPALSRDAQAVPTTGPFGWIERFSALTLPMQWMTINVPQHPWYSTGKRGLRITPSSTPLGDYATGQPAYIAHRLQHHKATITATVDGSTLQRGEQAGLALLQNETHFYAAVLARDEQGAAVELYRRASRDDAPTGVVLARVILRDAAAPVSFRFQLDGPSLDVFYATHGDDWQPLMLGLDASLISVATAGGFTGVTFGPFAYTQHVEQVAP